MMEGKVIGNLLGGVSQQPDSQRFSNTAAESINAWPSPLEGLRKRLGFKHIGEIVQLADCRTRVHMVERDGTEWYALVFTEAGGAWNVQAWDVNEDSPTYGQKINIYDSAYALPGTYADLSNYMNGATTSGRDMSLLTVGDTTFFVNHKKVPAMDSGQVSSAEQYRGFATVRAGAYGQQFGIGINDVSYIADYRSVNGAWPAGQTPPGDNANQSRHIGPNVIASRIQTEISGGPGPRYRLLRNSANQWFIQVWNASSGNFKIKIWYYNGSTMASSTTANMAWNVANGAMDSALESAHGGSTAWLVTDNPGGNSLADGYLINWSGGVAADGPMFLEFIDVSLGSSAQVVETVNRKQNVIELYDSTTDFTLEALDAARGVNIAVAKKTVKSISQLPLVCRDGFRIKVEPDAEDGAGSEDGYYVRFDQHEGTPGSFREGGWTESIGFGVETTIDPLTMPHVIVSYISVGAGDPTGLPLGTPYFVLKQGTWDTRNVGDDTTNPAPPWIVSGEPITGIAHHRGRLVLMGRDSVAMSESGQPGNFFRTTIANGLIDSDPIHLVSHLPIAASLTSGVELQENMILMSEVAQVRIDSGGNTLTPGTAGLRVVSSYRHDATARAVAAEYFGYFPFSRGSYTGIRQLWDASRGGASMYMAQDITEQVSSYLSGKVVDMAVSTAVNCLAVLTDAYDAIYVYRWEDAGEERVQSAWQKFTVGTGDSIESIGFAGSVLFATIRHHNNRVTLESLQMADGQGDDGSFPVLLDRRFTASAPGASVVYNAGPNTTTITCPTGYTLRSGEKLCVVEAAVAGQAPGAWTEVTATSDDQSTFDLAGDWSSKTLYFGLRFEFLHRMPRPYLEGAASGSQAPEFTGRTVVRKAQLEVEDTGYLRAEVVRQVGRGASTKKVDPYNPEKGVTITDARLSIPVLAPAEDFTLEFINDSPFPSRLIGLEYELTHTSRSRRRGR